MRDFEHIRETVNSIDEDVVTLYLHVNPGERANQSSPRGWEIYMKSAFKDIENEHIDNPDNNDAWQATRSQIEDFARDFRPSGGQSLVIFAGNETFHTHEIRVQLENNHAYGEPMVVPLLWAVDEHEHYIVALTDREQARILDVYLGRATINDEVEIDIQGYDFRDKNYINANPGGGAGGENVALGNAMQGGNDKFQDMKQEYTKRFHKNVADEIRKQMDNSEATRLILGGVSESAHAVKDHLPQNVQDMLVGILDIPLVAEAHEVVEQIHQLATNYERSQEMEMVEEVIGFAKADGRGALGDEAVHRAFEMQQVETLFLPWPPADRDKAHHYTQLAMKSGANVELVHGSPAMRLRREGEVAARLYYYIGEKPTENEQEEAEPSSS